MGGARAAPMSAPPVLIKIRTMCLSEPWSRKIKRKKIFSTVPGTRRFALFAFHPRRATISLASISLAILVPPILLPSSSPSPHGSKQAASCPSIPSLIIVQVFFKERITRSMFTASSKLFIRPSSSNHPSPPPQALTLRLHGLFHLPRSLVYTSIPLLFPLKRNKKTGDPSFLSLSDEDDSKMISDSSPRSRFSSSILLFVFAYFSSLFRILLLGLNFTEISAWTKRNSGRRKGRGGNELLEDLGWIGTIGR